jgi:uncharacterized protein YcaQ
VLRVAGLWLEPGVRPTATRRRALDAELDRLRRFTGATRVAYDRGVEGWESSAGVSPGVTRAFRH